MRATRTLLAAAGVAVVLYGAWLLVRGQSVSQLVQVVEWAAAAVIIHDALLAPLAFGVGWVVQRRLPRRSAPGVAVALILVGTVAVAGFAVLTRSHDGSGNTTLLDRDYPVGLLLVAVGVSAGVAVAAVLGRLRRSRGWRG